MVGRVLQCTPKKTKMDPGCFLLHVGASKMLLGMTATCKGANPDPEASSCSAASLIPLIGYGHHSGGPHNYFCGLLCNDQCNDRHTALD